MNRSRLGIVLVLIVVAGCHKHAHKVAAVPPPAPPIAVVAPVPAALTEAESAFEAGDYLRAAVSYEFYFQSRPQSNEMDRIRFRYGVAQSLSGVSGMESASTDTFNRLIRDFPDSSYIGPARMALALQGEVSRLQLDKSIRDERIRQLTALIPPAPPVLPPALAEADAAFTRGDFQRAASAYDSYLQTKPQSTAMDAILFHYGVSQSMSNASPRETASTETFKLLIKDYSGSPYASSAKRILEFRDTQARLQQSDSKAKDDKIRQLTDELDKLKKIDSERRRTP